MIISRWCTAGTLGSEASAKLLLKWNQSAGRTGRTSPKISRLTSSISSACCLSVRIMWVIDMWAAPFSEQLWPWSAQEENSDRQEGCCTPFQYWSSADLEHISREILECKLHHLYPSFGRQRSNLQGVDERRCETSQGLIYFFLFFLFSQLISVFIHFFKNIMKKCIILCVFSHSHFSAQVSFQVMTIQIK